MFMYMRIYSVHDCIICQTICYDLYYMLVIKCTSISVLKDWVFLPLPLPFPLAGGAADVCDLTSVEVTDASRVMESVVYMVSSHNIIKQD